MSRKVLIVEDEDVIAELLRRRLDEAGYDVEMAYDSDEALQYLGQEKPQLILMDIGLGEFSLDGWGLNQKVKENPQTQAIPIIAVTAHAQRVEHHDRAIREGFVDHIAKPIDFDALLETVAKHLSPD